MLKKIRIKLMLIFVISIENVIRLGSITVSSVQRQGIAPSSRYSSVHPAALYNNKMYKYKPAMTSSDSLFNPLPDADLGADVNSQVARPCGQAAVMT